MPSRSLRNSIFWQKTLPTVLGGGAALLGAIAANANEGRPGDGLCGTDGVISVMCGAEQPEDLVALNGTPWVLATRYNQGIALIHKRRRTIDRLFPSTFARVASDTKLYPDCATTARTGGDPLRVLGLAARPTGSRRFRVFATAMNEQAGVHVLELDLRGPRPLVTLVGCVPAPGTMFLNSVTPLPEGGFAVTHFAEQDDLLHRRELIAQGFIRGEVLEWHPAKGWSKVPNSGMASPNGIVVSPDGKYLFVCAYGDKKIVRLARGAAVRGRSEVSTSFNMDNIRWDPQGQLLATGHTATRTAVFRVNPRTLQVETLLDRPDDNLFRRGTVAIQVGRDIWIGSSRGTHIAVMPAR